MFSFRCQSFRFSTRKAGGPSPHLKLLPPFLYSKVPSTPFDHLRGNNASSVYPHHRGQSFSTWAEQCSWSISERFLPNASRLTGVHCEYSLDVRVMAKPISRGPCHIKVTPMGISPHPPHRTQALALMSSHCSDPFRTPKPSRPVTITYSRYHRREVLSRTPAPIPEPIMSSTETTSQGVHTHIINVHPISILSLRR